MNIDEGAKHLRKLRTATQKKTKIQLPQEYMVIGLGDLNPLYTPDSDFAEGISIFIGTPNGWGDSPVVELGDIANLNYKSVISMHNIRPKDLLEVTDEAYTEFKRVNDSNITRKQVACVAYAAWNPEDVAYSFVTFYGLRQNCQYWQTIASAGEVGHDAFNKIIQHNTNKKSKEGISLDRMGDVPDTIFHQAEDLAQDLFESLDTNIIVEGRVLKKPYPVEGPVLTSLSRANQYRSVRFSDPLQKLH